MEQTPPLGVFVRRIRESRGYTVAEVASRGQLSEGSVSGIETGARGKNPHRDTLLRLAAGLRATDDERDELLRLGGHPPATDLPPTPTVVEAVNTDTKLRADQKRVLLELYKTMVR